MNSPERHKAAKRSIRENLCKSVASLLRFLPPAPPSPRYPAPRSDVPTPAPPRSSRATEADRQVTTQSSPPATLPPTSTLRPPPPPLRAPAPPRSPADDRPRPAETAQKPQAFPPQ